MEKKITAIKIDLEKACEQAKKIAKEGTTEEKQRFVNWALDSILYLNEQIAHNCGTKEMIIGRDLITIQYKAFLESMNEKSNN